MPIGRPHYTRIQVAAWENGSLAGMRSTFVHNRRADGKTGVVVLASLIPLVPRGTAVTVWPCGCAQCHGKTDGGYVLEEIPSIKGVRVILQTPEGRRTISAAQLGDARGRFVGSFVDPYVKAETDGTGCPRRS
jgi:hypothetical protein